MSKSNQHGRKHLLRQMYGTKCFYCGCEMVTSGNRAMTIDHLIPLSRFPQAVMMPRGNMQRRGKRKNPAWDLWNLVLCCSGCNGAKGDMIWYEYYQTDVYWKRRASVAAERPSKLPRIVTELTVHDEGTLHPSTSPGMFVAVM